MSNGSTRRSKIFVSSRPKPGFLTKTQTSSFMDIMFELNRTLDSKIEDNSFSREELLRDVLWSKFSSPGYSTYTGKRDSSPKMRLQAAIDKWLAAERRNYKTNNRLPSQEVDFGFVRSTQVRETAKRFITETIGSTPPSLLRGSFTNGASTRVKRSPVSVASKFVGKAHVTASALPFWTGNVFQFPLWFGLSPESWTPEVVSGSVLFTVPKNSEIDRVACKEPEVNMYFQRGVGDFIRKRLKRSGIDLNDQTCNQRLAREGSKLRNLATLDLSSASDTVSRAIVEQLLPVKWFELLDDLRVKETILPNGDSHQLEMFSSMGNGFTFELETLIFWALARSVAFHTKTRGKISVYGDDIIVPIKVANCLTRVLPWFGFILNDKKSFRTGPFRESCGGWYYNGMDVTPFFLRETPKHMTDVIRFGNQLLNWILKDAIPELLGDFVSLWSQVAKFVPRCYHGGQSLDRSDALVTGDSPRRRYVQVNMRLEADPLGSYLQWHHEKDPIFGQPDRELSPSWAASPSRWVNRPNKTWYEHGLMSDVRYVLTNQFSFADLAKVDGSTIAA